VARPVAYGPALVGVRTDAPLDDGTLTESFSEGSFDPQVTLRYRANPNHTVYAKMARATKAAYFDTSNKSLPAPDAFFTDAEHAENYELGAKGTFLDGSARYNATLFWMTVKDLQNATAEILIGPDGQLEVGGNVATNAGRVRNRGLEFDLTWAATERLRAGFTGAVMDAIYTDFRGAGCNDVELRDADTGPCLTIAESIAQFGSDDAAGTIDRTGQQLSRSPDWKFVLNLDYWHPLFDRYKATFNTRFAYSDELIIEPINYEVNNMFGVHENLDMNVGFGDIDDVWHVSLWASNITNSRVEYFVERDAESVGHHNMSLPYSYFRTYGLQLQYNFR
jgi:iron complex outermembrane receptor protein